MSIFVTLLPNGKKYTVKPGASLLQLENVIPFGCRAGACGMCAVRVRSSQKSLSKINQDEKTFLDCLGLDNTKFRLACQCRVLDDVVIEV